jgi:uroporphyrinogen-III synthase
MNVWVTRPEPGLTRTAAALRACGHEVLAAPLLEISPVPPSPAPSLPWPDWVLLVSANAVRGLHAADLGEPRSRFAAVGQRTAAEATDLGYPVDLVPEQERAEGLLAALASEELTGRRVWIPAGDRPGSARSQLPVALAKRGALVEVFQVYATHERALTAGERRTLDTQEPGAVVVFSPSAADCLFASDAPAIQRWRQQAATVAIGPVSRVRLEELGANQIVEAQQPSDAGVIEVLARLEAEA